MEKKKRIISKLIFALVIAAIVSMCFVGTTLARYVSSNGGSATTGVALWNIDFGEIGATDAEFGNLSPDDTAYAEVAAATSNRSHSTAKTHVATIQNTGDVDADVTIKVGETIDYTYMEMVDDAFTGGSEWTNETVVGEDTVPAKTNVDKLFSITLYYGTSEDADSATTKVTESATPVSATDGVIYVYAVVTWTSDDFDLKTNADKLDTWVGENIETVSFALMFEAVQASTSPTTGS